MGTGYTRQSAAEIQTGEVIEAAPLNAEFNQLQSAFDSTVGHTHDGTVGEGPKINLTNSVTGVLPVANGGNGGINKIDATTAPTAGDDTNDGYAVGSIWIDVTNDVLYVCVDATATAAIWQRYTLYDAGLTSIAGLTTAANKMIYTTASDVYAVTDLTAYARTLLDDADASTALSTLGVSTYIKTLLDDADATTARATLGLTIGTNVQAQDAELQAIAGLSSSSDTVPYFTGSGTAALATFTAAGRAIVDDADATAQRATLGLVIGTDVEAHDATLTALAAYNTNGILTQTAADTFVGRTLTGTANELTVTNGNGVSGNPTISLPSAMTFTGKTITGGTFSTLEGLGLISTDAGATIGPIAELYRDSASPAASDILGAIDFNGRDSAANKQLYARIYTHIFDPTSGSEDSFLNIQAATAGTVSTIASFTGNAAVINGTLTVTG